MSSVPDEPTKQSADLPARRLSAPEVEAVLRRAVELQVHEGEHHAGGHEGMPESELVRIGHEIGLSPRHIQQALAETSAVAEPQEGGVGSSFGPGFVQVSRPLRIPAARAVAELDRYLREREWMVVHRRFADRTVYTRASGFAADLQRGLAGLSQKYPRLDVKELEVGVRSADEGTCYVSIRVDMRNVRTGWLTGGLIGGTGTGGAVALVLGIAIAPPAALVGAPLMLAGVLGSRAVYQRTLEQKRSQMESILDRLEHGELAPSAAPRLRDRFGF